MQISHNYINTYIPSIGSDGKESACNTGDVGLIPGLGRSPGEGTDNPLQYSRLENSMDRGAWQATVHSVAQSQAWLKRLSTQHTPPSGTSLPSSQPTFLGHRRAPGWAACAIQQFPPCCCFTHDRVCKSMLLSQLVLPCKQLHPHHISRFHTYMLIFNTCVFFLSYFTLCNGPYFHPPQYNWLKFIYFYGWVIFQRKEILT